MFKSRNAPVSAEWCELTHSREGRWKHLLLLQVLYTHTGSTYGAELSDVAFFQHAGPLLGVLWGGHRELGVKAHVHFPTPRLPPLLQCSAPLWLTGINDLWMTEKPCCFSRWLASSSPGRNDLKQRKQKTGPIRMQHGPCTFLCKGKHTGRTALVLCHWLVSSYTWMWLTMVGQLQGT